MSHDLPRPSACHGHNVDIFPGLCSWLILQKPVQLIQLHNFQTCCGFFFSFRLTALFYPIHYIGFVHPQNLSHATAANSTVVHFDRQFSSLFRILMPFRVYRVIYTALLTLATLAPRSAISCLDLVLYLSAFRVSFPCIFFLIFSNYTIKSLLWTLST